MSIITNAGFDQMATLLINNFPYIANGTGSSAEDATHTTLEGENTANGSARKQATRSTSSVGVSSWDVIFSFTGNVTVRKIGIFSASSNGTLLYERLLASNRNYVDGDSMEVLITHTYARGT